MRSRFSAFSKGDIKYLIKTHASNTQDKSLAKGLKETCDNYKFTRLDVLSSEDGLANQLSGYVSFVAWFKDKGGDNLGLQQIAEKSYFERSSIKDKWLYIDGVALTQLKPSRNDSCPCNSGNKFKRCCA
jgi:SEC-C motif-containing protein